MHRAEHDPWWFSSDGSGRFDLAPPDGTCYLADTPLGALQDHFDGLEVILQDDLEARRISALGAGALRLADCTSPRARSFGVDLALSAGSDYERTQRFAAWFRDGGLHGVRYFLRNDPAATLIGVALFGSAGEQDLPVLSTALVEEALLDEAARTFAIEILPLP